jgi:hypothetical protein
MAEGDDDQVRVVEHGGRAGSAMRQRELSGGGGDVIIRHRGPTSGGGGQCGEAEGVEAEGAPGNPL